MYLCLFLKKKILVHFLILFFMHFGLKRYLFTFIFMHLLCKNY